MKKLFVVLIFISVTAIGAYAQSTTVSGQVTDAGGQSWNNGTVTAQFVPNPQYPTFPQYTWTGGTLSPTVSGTLSTTGGYSISVPSSTAITPINSTWQFKFCPNASSPCFTTGNTTVTGGTQTVNATPPAISVNAGSSTNAYADSEVTGNAVGQIYYNVTGAILRVCQALPCASNWGPVGGVSNSPGIPINNGNLFYFTAYAHFADTQGVNLCNDASGNTVTCTTNGNFIATDQGKQIWCSATGNNTADYPQTTIATVNSTTSITLTGTLTRALTNGQCTYGHDDTANLNAFWISVVAPIDCGSAVFPASGMIFSAAVMLTNPTHCNFGQAPYPMQILGQGPGQTVFYPAPNFTYNSVSACAAAVAGNNTGCFGPGNAYVTNIALQSGMVNNLQYTNTYNGPWINITTPGFWFQDNFVTITIPGNSQGINIASGSAFLRDIQDYQLGGNGTGPLCSSIVVGGADVQIDNVYVLSFCNDIGESVTVNTTSPGNYTTTLHKLSGMGGQANYALLIEGTGTTSTIAQDIQNQLGTEVTGANNTYRVSQSYSLGNAGTPCMFNILSGATVYATNVGYPSSGANGVCVDATSSFVDGGANILTAATATASITAGGKFTPNPTSTYNGNSLSGTFTATGTGACSTIGTPTGNIFSGSFKCNGTSGAATITLTLPSSNGGNGYKCDFKDVTTTADTIQPTPGTASTCAASSAALVSGDVIQFSAAPF